MATANLPTKVPTPTTTPASSSLLYIVDAPYTSPADNATTLANAVTKGHGLADTTVLGIASGVIAPASTTGTGAVVRATSPALVTPTGIVKGDVGLGNVDNTSDATKNSAVATLTNKTLSGNTAVTLISGSGTLTLNTAGTITLPNATDTLVGKATTDTLTNKTLTSAVLNTGVSGTAVDTDSTMAANSDTLLPSQKAVKTALATKQTLDSDLTTIAGLTATTDNFLQSKSSAWTSRTPTQVTADLIPVVGDTGSGGTKGLVPAPGAGDAAASKYLKADGTWATIAGGGTGDVVGPSSATDNAVARFDATTGKLIQNSAVTIADTSGDITGGKYNTVAISGASTPTLAVTGTTTVSGANTGDQTNISGNAATVTTNANLTGPITSSGNATAIASQTGTGTKFVVDTSPTLVTPILGVAAATSINKMAVTAPATSSTLAVADGKTLTASNTLTLAGTDSTVQTFPSTSATIARTDAAQTFTGTQTFAQTVQTPQAITVSTNAGTADILHGSQVFTNSSAATMAITLTTTSAVDGQTKIVRIYDFSAVAQTIGWTGTENSTVTAPTTSNGSTTLPLTVGFIFNGSTSKWRCVASA